MSEQILKVNKVGICTEIFGNPKDPAVLLIMGAMSSLDWWDEDFCLRLADQGDLSFGTIIVIWGDPSLMNLVLLTIQ